MGLLLYPARRSVRMPKDEIDLAPVKSEEEDSETSLRPYEILSYPADYTLEVLVDKWKKVEISSPKLQRRYIWPQARASKLIESFLLGLPVPPIFLYQEREDNNLIIVDGHQRLRSIAYFFSGYFGEEGDPNTVPFNLIGLHQKSPFLNATYQHLENTDHAAINRLKNSVLRAFIMKQVNPADDTSIIEVFGRLNTGGMILQGQEIRNCVYEGRFNELLKRLNKNKDWRKIVGTLTEDKRMRDVELILRFLALFYNVKNYEKPMKDFLNKFMNAHRRPHAPAAEDDGHQKKKAIAARRKEFEAQMKEFEDLFTQTAEAVVKFLGSKPFHIARGLNAAVFDSVFTAFARHLDKVSDGKVSAAKTKHVYTKYKTLLENKQYKKWYSAATTDKDVVPRRLKKAEKLLFG
jgi:hypothetical protein